MYHYNKSGNNFQLVTDEGKVVWEGPEVAICFDKRDGTMYRHGNPTIVNEVFNSATSTYVARGVCDIAESLVVVTSAAWGLELLNRCINITGYLCRMARYYGLEITPPIGDIADEAAAKSQKRHGGEEATPPATDPVKYPPFAHTIQEFKVPVKQNA